MAVTVVIPGSGWSLNVVLISLVGRHLAVHYAHTVSCKSNYAQLLHLQICVNGDRERDHKERGVTSPGIPSLG